MNHYLIIAKWIGERIKETGFKYECIAWCKKYYQETGLKGLFFGGSAINGWEGKGNLNKWFVRTENPTQGDMVFYSPTLTNPHGHVAIYHNKDNIVEQNGGIGTGTGKGNDAIRMTRPPQNILGYMTLNIVDKRVNDFADKHGINGRSKTKPYTQYEILMILSKI